MRVAQAGAVRSAIFAIVFACTSALLAQEAPRPPCAGPPVPNYAVIGQQPIHQVWRNTRKGWWTPPPCTGWGDAGSNLVIALAGTFRHTGNADELLNRFGAVSTLRGIRYWSVTDKDWRVLVMDAAALAGPEAKDRRPDFAPAEMKGGRDLYFAQHDTRSTGEVVYRMRVREAGADRLVLEMENLSPIRLLFVTLFSPGDMKFLYFLERRAGGQWGSYALLAANGSYADNNEASFINRAAAFYRHFIGVPADGAPPLAR